MLLRNYKRVPTFVGASVSTVYRKGFSTDNVACTLAATVNVSIIVNYCRCAIFTLFDAKVIVWGGLR